MSEIGKEIRLCRLLNSDKRGLVVTLDHGLPIGPMPGIINVKKTLELIATGQPDGVLLTPGHARSCKEFFLGKDKPSLVLRLDWTNMFQPKTVSEGYAPIRRVRDAVKYGADAVLTYLFHGYQSGKMQSLNIRNLSKIASECDDLGIPLIVEAMARGGLIKGHEVDIDVMGVPVRMAAEIGADIIKTDYTGQRETFNQLVKSCPVPIMIAGGAKMNTTHEALESVNDAMKVGAVGVFFGRNIFQSHDPLGMVKALGAIIHKGAETKQAEQMILHA